MHADTKQLFSSLESVRGESAALALADECLKAMSQKAFDWHRLNAVPLESLLGQVLVLHTWREPVMTRRRRRLRRSLLCRASGSGALLPGRRSPWLPPPAGAAAAKLPR
jgi:hypothetical protein